MEITFNEPVNGFTLSNLSLTTGGGANLLTGNENLTTIDNGTTWMLTGLAPLTTKTGVYTVSLPAAG